MANIATRLSRLIAQSRWGRTKNDTREWILQTSSKKKKKKARSSLRNPSTWLDMRSISPTSGLLVAIACSEALRRRYTTTRDAHKETLHRPKHPFQTTLYQNIPSRTSFPEYPSNHPFQWQDNFSSIAELSPEMWFWRNLALEMVRP